MTEEQQAEALVILRMLLAAHKAMVGQHATSSTIIEAEDFLQQLDEEDDPFT